MMKKKDSMLDFIKIVKPFAMTWMIMVSEGESSEGPASDYSEVRTKRLASGSPPFSRAVRTRERENKTRKTILTERWS